MTKAAPRGIFLTLFVGAIALVALYFARRAPEWPTERRLTFVLAVAAMSALVLVGDWLVRRDAPRGPRRRS